jgi:hypothetical protein
MRTTLLAAAAAAVALLAVSAASTVGCKRLAEKAAEKAEEKAIENAGGGKVQINSGENGSMTIVTDAGAVTIGTGAKIPDDFPKEVPVYPGAKPTMAMKSANAGKDVWSVTMETPDTKDKIVAFYKSKMTGFTEQAMQDMGQASILVYVSPKYQVTVTANGQGGKTDVMLSVAVK